VHPNKLEVRFQNPFAVADAVETIVGEAMGGESFARRIGGEEPQIAPQEQPEPENEGISLVPLETGEEPEFQNLKPVVVLAPGRKAPMTLRENSAPPAIAAVMAGESPDIRPALPLETRQETMPIPEAGSMPRLLGIAFRTYWIFEAGERLMWVDQHAAHERVLYDKLLKQCESGLISQSLLSPQLVRLTAREYELFHELKPLLEEAGFSVEPFDDTSVAVHAIPTVFGKNEPAGELLLEALAEGTAGRGQSTREKVRWQVAQMACKRAVRAGDELSDSDVAQLLAEMLATDIMPTCPHGRPIVIETSKRELEKRFRRVP
jgi:DNA mismatch repair protein MutL